ncbi:MAG: DUF2029 domain-containing protein, partial [Acidimicrobiaceae bacterium]|nr:DUF2029 domain-containing protein [Acidimicrobiaceae bacterium]
VIGLWVLAILGTAGLAYERYHLNAWAVPGDFRSRGDDFWIFFHAAYLISHGHTPYNFGFGLHGDGYVYSPLVALVIWPFLHLGVSAVWHLWLVASIAALLGAVVLVMKNEGPFERDWRAPVLFGFMVGSMLRFMPTDLIFNNGNSDALVLVLMAFAVWSFEKGRSSAGGVFMSLGGVVKTWPWGIALVLARRDFPQRRKTFVAFVVTAVVAPVLALIIGGTSELASWIRVTLHASSQKLISCSVWGAPQALFSRSGLAHPYFVSAPLRWACTVILAAWVFALLAMCLRWSDSFRLGFWNILGILLLLLPVSHSDNTMYLVPILWIWAARALANNRLRSSTTMVFAALALWWLVLFPTAFFNWLPSAAAIDVEVPFFANLVAVTISVLADHFVHENAEHSAMKVQV